MAAVATRLERAKYQLRSLDVIGLSCLTDGLSLFDNGTVIGFVLADAGLNEPHDAHFFKKWRLAMICNKWCDFFHQWPVLLRDGIRHTVHVFIHVLHDFAQELVGVSVPSSAQVIAPIIAMSVPIAAPWQFSLRFVRFVFHGRIQLARFSTA